jgi:mannose-6-phosphate isomerase
VGQGPATSQARAESKITRKCGSTSSMTPLDPLLLSPKYIERIWGSRNLAPFYHAPSSEVLIGEVWLTGDDCRVQDGNFAGRSLGQMVAEYREDLVGTLTRNRQRFPLLLKVLFPQEKLSVQVHPDDTAARAVGQDCGKTECWYVLEAGPKAQVAAGLKQGTTRSQVERAIQDLCLEELLNWLPVHRGDMIYVDAGTVHTIGPGSVLLETQQNSDTTYRLYDYGRPRELHLERGLAALKLQTRAGKVEHYQVDGHRRLVDCPCFVVKHFDAGAPVRLNTIANTGSGEALSTVHCIFGIEGRGSIDVSGGARVTLERGQIVVVPACTREYEILPQDGKFEFLCAYLPAEASC